MTTRRRFTSDFKAKVALEALRGDKTIQVLTWFACTLCREAIYWIVLSPRSASSATRALKLAVNRRRVVICVFLHQMAEYTLNNCPIFWDHLSQAKGSGPGRIGKTRITLV